MNESDKESRIIEAALNLFSNKGFHQTTVSEIAEEADVAKGTVYWYFDSKEQLFQAILLTKIKKLNTSLKAKIESLDKPQEMLEELIRSYLDFYAGGKKVAKMHRESTITIGQEFKEKMLDFNQQQVDLITDIIKLGQSEGIINKDINIADTAYLIIGMVNAFHPHIYVEEKFDIESKLESTLDLLFNGLS